MKQSLTIDQAGRIVLPKAVRDRFRLARGTTLTMQVEADSITLRPDSVRTPLVRKGTLMVHHGTPTSAWIDPVKQSRQDRDHQVWGE